MATSGGYVTGVPATSTVSVPAPVTPAAGAASLALYDNSEIEAIEIGFGGPGVNNLMSTLIALGKNLSGGEYGDLNLAETMTNNYPEIKFKEIDTTSRDYENNATVAAGATTLTFVSTVGLQSGDILRSVVSNEEIRVESVTNATTVVVARGAGSVAAAALTAGDALIHVGNAIATSVGFIDAYAAPAVDKVNYIQKFATAVKITDEDKLSNKAGGQAAFVKRYMAERTKFHMNSIEMASIFGQKKSGTDAQGRNYYKTEGALHTALRGWTGDLSGSLSITTIEREFGRTFPYGSTTKILLLGSEARGALRNLFENRIQVSSIDNSEVKLSSIEFSGGKILLVDHPFMDTRSGYSKYGILIDPSCFTIVYPQGEGFEDKMDGKTIFVMDPTSNRYLEKGEFSTYLGFKNVNANAHGVFKLTA